MKRVHCVILIVAFAVAQGSSAFAGWGHGHWGGIARSNWGWSGTTYKKNYSTSRNYNYSTPKYSTPKYSTQKYSTSTYSSPSYSTPSYSTTPSYPKTVYVPKPTPTHHPEPVIVRKVEPIRASLQIRILCPKGEHGECAYTLITASGSPFDYTISAGEKQTIVVKDSWKIKFRPERGEQWVGYNLTPGTTYSLQRDENGFWDLFEM